MNGNNERIVSAYGDESIRMLGSPPFYMLGVCVLNNADSADFDALATGMGSIEPAS